MKNYKSFIILTLLFLNFKSIEAQENKSSISFNVGLQNSNLLFKNFYSIVNEEGSYPTNQTSRNFIDLNIIYNRTIWKSKFETNIGVGFNQKGYNEIGMGSDGSPHYIPYKIIVCNSYLTGLGGLSYNFYSNKSVNGKIGVFLIPNINLDNNNLYNKVSLSNRINLNFKWKFSKNIFITTNPYFETALTKFNKTKLTNNSTNYLPYAYGINFGIELKR